MLHVAYFSAPVREFLSADPDAILGAMAQRHGFSLEHQQRSSWLRQIGLLQTSLCGVPGAHIFFEFAIPRMGKRADVVILLHRTVVVIEFKVGADTFDRAAIDQAHDYALDLKNFHSGSHCCPIVPLLIATEAPLQPCCEITWAQDGVATPVCIGAGDIAGWINKISVADGEGHNGEATVPDDWAHSGYKPTPTIVEAAQALYRDHDVTEITRSDSGAKNLADTTAGPVQGSARRRAGLCHQPGFPGHALPPGGRAPTAR